MTRRGDAPESGTLSAMGRNQPSPDAHPATDPEADPAPVLVTGCAGNLGRAAVAGLRAAGRAVRGLDRVPHPDLDPQWVGDLNDRDAVNHAVAGCGAVVHLAGQPDPGRPFDELLDANLRGFHTVLDAAVEAGVGRVVFASSAQTVANCDHRPLTAGDCGPLNAYALMKLWAEELGRFTAARRGIAFLAVRIGWTPPDRYTLERIGATDHGRQLYLSHGDAGRFFALAADADAGPPAGGAAVVYAVSRGDGEQTAFDLKPAGELIGYVPRDVFPEGLAEHVVSADSD